MTHQARRQRAGAVGPKHQACCGGAGAGSGSHTQGHKQSTATRLHRQHAGGPGVEPGDRGRQVLKRGRGGAAAAPPGQGRARQRAHLLCTGWQLLAEGTTPPNPCCRPPPALPQLPPHLTEQSILLHSQPAEGSQMSTSSGGTSGCGAGGAGQGETRSHRRRGRVATRRAGGSCHRGPAAACRSCIESAPPHTHLRRGGVVPAVPQVQAQAAVVMVHCVQLITLGGACGSAFGVWQHVASDAWRRQKGG